MVQVILWAGVAVASFAAAAVLVFAIVRATEHHDETGDSGRTDERTTAARRLLRRSEPAWWPEFEREFADYVGAGDGRRS